MSAEKSGPRPRRPTVLVVDGDPLVRRLLARFLEPLGCVLALAASAAEARALCAGRPRYLVAVVDLVLGDGDGVDLIEELRDELGDRAPPFVILSGDRPDRRPDCVVAILEKPMGIVRVIPFVTAALDDAAAIASSAGPAGQAPRRRPAYGAVVEEHVPADERDPRRER